MSIAFLLKSPETGDLGNRDSGASGVAPFVVKELREGADYVEAALELLPGFFGQAVHKFKVAPHHPVRSAAGIYTAEKLKGGPDGNHDPVTEVRFQQRHEKFLLWCPESHPHDFRAVLFNHPRDCRIIEIPDTAERQFDELHVGNLRIIPLQILFQAVKNMLLRTEKYHAVFP